LTRTYTVGAAGLEPTTSCL